MGQLLLFLLLIAGLILIYKANQIRLTDTLNALFLAAFGAAVSFVSSVFMVVISL